jgi:hypothetical protein
VEYITFNVNFLNFWMKFLNYHIKLIKLNSKKGSNHEILRNWLGF